MPVGEERVGPTTGGEASAGGVDLGKEQLAAFDSYFVSPRALEVAASIARRDSAHWVDAEELVNESYIRVTRALRNRLAAGAGPILNDSGTFDDALVVSYAEKAIHRTFYDLIGSNRRLSRTKGLSFDRAPEGGAYDARADSELVSLVSYATWERGESPDASSTVVFAAALAQLARWRDDKTLDQLCKHGPLVGCMVEKILRILLGDPELGGGSDGAEGLSDLARGGASWFDSLVYEALGLCDPRYVRPDGGFSAAARQMKRVLSSEVEVVLRGLIADHAV